MKVVVASPLQAGSQWAHALNTIKMADGFAKLGYDVTLISRSARRGPMDIEHLRSMYGLTPSLNWHQIKSHWGPLPTVRAGIMFSYAAYRLTRIMKPDFIYARDYYFPWLCSRGGIITAVESHAAPGTDSRAFAKLVSCSTLESFAAWVTISERLREFYVSINVPAEKIHVLPDAVDFELFRRPAELPASPFAGPGPHVVYAGHLYDYKGIPTIIECARDVPGATFHFVGGWPADVTRHEQQCRQSGIHNVQFHGLVAHARVPAYLWHADALLLVPSAHHPSAAWTSPVKLGEYLASGTPVISSDIPALRAWLSDRHTVFVKADDPGALAQGIRRVIAHDADNDAMIRAGLRLARTLTYETRARTIMQQVAAAV